MRAKSIALLAAFAVLLAASSGSAQTVDWCDDRIEDEQLFSDFVFYTLN